MSDAGEIAKAVGPLTELTKTLFGPMADELGHIIGDRMKEYRFRNWLAVMTRTKKLMEEAHIAPGAVPPRLLLPIVEASSVEDEPSLQEMWSGLLATASAKPQSLSPAFVETLKQLSPLDAKGMMYFYREFRKIADVERKPLISVVFNYRVGTQARIPFEGLNEAEWQGFGKINKEVLLQLGLLDRHYWVESDVSFARKDRKRNTVIDFDIKPTVYGIRFLAACSGDLSEESDGESEDIPIN